MFRTIAAGRVSVAARCFSTTPVVRAGGFTAFIKYAYRSPALKKQLSKLPITKRGVLLGQKYNALPAVEKAKFVIAGSKIKVKRGGQRRRSGGKRKLSAYNRFVRTASTKKEIKALPVKKRMAAIAKLWKKAQK